jgi:hypothetical protein
MCVSVSRAGFAIGGKLMYVSVWLTGFATGGG